MCTEDVHSLFLWFSSAYTEAVGQNTGTENPSYVLEHHTVPGTLMSTDVFRTAAHIRTIV